MSHTSLLEELPLKEVKTSIGNSQRSLEKTSKFRKLLKEPFLHFLVLGGLIFLIGDYVKHHSDHERYEITVGKEELYRLASLWEKQYGAVPSKTELKALADNFVREEILYREGLEMGLDKNDEVIRRRIAQKLEFLQQDLVIIKDPTDQELRAYYEKNQTKYSLPEKVSFTHVYFSGDNGGDASALTRARTVLADLQAKKLNRAPELGDRFAYLYDYSELSETNVVHQFGESELSKKIVSLPQGQWSGPLQSGYGYHLVYVTGKTAPAVQPLAEVKEKVTADYVLALREKKNNEAFAKIADKYTILKDEVSNEATK